VCLFKRLWKHGNPVITFEDVDVITNIGPRTDGYGPTIRHADINAFQQPVKDETGQSLIDKINLTDGRALYEPNFLHFMKKYMYIEAGNYDDDNNWHSNSIISGFPVDYDPGDKPHNKSFFLCLNGGWWYIPPIVYPPDAKTCDVKEELCDYPPCIKEEKEDGDEDGNGIPDEVKVEKKHLQPTKNAYKNLAQVLYGKKLPGVPIEKDSSGKVFNMTFRDRTPPVIKGCVDGSFPEIGKDKPARTGDWYRVEGLTISDNSSDYLGTCLCLGKIDGYPGLSWKDAQDWIKEEPFQKVKNNEETQYVIMPNSCHGIMLYSIFAWDESGLLNPGEPNIVENKPEICYGLTDPPGDSKDLSRKPDEAKPWPIRVNYADGQVEKVNSGDINPDLKRGTGFLHIVDNDLPNILIKFRSVKDGKTFFFPPVIQPLDLPIFSSSDYKKTSGLEEPNAKDYEDFVGAGSDVVFTSELVDKEKPLYFKILDIKASSEMDPAEEPLLERLKKPGNEDDFDFIRKNFRLEDYKESDTDVDGNPIVGDTETFGKRNGVCGEVRALLEMPLQEDVEYLVSIWADDNVKWATVDESGEVMENILAIPTGIKQGEAIIEIPNQVPKMTHKIPLDPAAATTPEFKVVFREPTPPGGKDEESFYLNKKFPFIEVTAADFAGLTRKIRLYLRISNENPNIRIIESQHEKGL
jgi:hypothetical protein